MTDAVIQMVAIDDLMAIAAAHPVIARALWRETLIEAARFIANRRN